MFTAIQHDFEGFAAERFRSYAAQLRRLQQQGASSEQLDTLCRDEMRWIETAAGLNGCREKYEACARLITDLAKLRWRIVQNGFGIELAAPNVHKVSSSQIASYKKSVRMELESQLRYQFRLQSVRDFIRRMERPTPSSNKQSVLVLIADGRELRSRLLAASEACGESRVALCGEAVRPYLQLVEPGEKDEFTGHNLSDIWRYFRYTWAIPATNVPGRNLFYLIRDASHPSHAVMGITALSNAPLALRDRDRSIGWSSIATQEEAQRLACLSDPESSAGLSKLLHDLEANLQCGLNSISHDQLLEPHEAVNPTEDVIERLKRRASEFATKREEVLSATDFPLTLNELEEHSDATPSVSEEVLSLEAKFIGNEKMNAARSALIVKKRASELARILQARLVLREHRERLLSPANAPSTYALDTVVTAVNTAWVSAKNSRAGTSMLEMTVCGAVRPYNHILGGKLTALLMLSPEVAHDYTLRYGGAVSIISSMMRNKPVVKDSKLVFLGTTSLYLHGASQYNRIRLPAGVISSEQTEIRYEAMGETGGFGTVQFSSDTVEAIEKVVNSSKGYRQVNSVFGEGRSPKLRKLRTGFDELGFDAQILLQHHQPRVIYGVKLFSGADEFLRTGSGKMPDFILEPGGFRDATERIAAFWRERWLARRLDYLPLLEMLADSPAWALSQSIPTEDRLSEEDMKTPILEVETLQSSSPQTSDTLLWESLAGAGHNTCSDCINDVDLERLHVPSPLEKFLTQRAAEGYSLILTGNAGDGKTHLLRRIAAELENLNAVVDLDATAVMRQGSVTPILDRWRGALHAGRPYCLAANEYPLHLLIRAGNGALPEALHRELVRQTRERLSYSATSDPSETAREKVLVIDLSLRNPLAESFSLAALRRMLDDPAVLAHAASGADFDFTWNHRKLSESLVQQRLGAVFQKLADRGNRCTIRELWICLARLLFGDPSERADGPPPAGLPRSWYSTRLFTLPSSGIRFNLGKLLQDEVDPAKLSHPHWDSKLEYAAEMDSSLWLDGIPTVEVAHSDQRISIQRFDQLKRRFYFEHTSGEELFALTKKLAGDFSGLLRGAVMADEILIKGVIQAINHAYCPIPFSGCDRDLYLWFSHRYHEQPTRAYVASRSIPAASFAVHLPRLPSRIEAAFDYRADHLMFECDVRGKRCGLLIDFEMHSILGQLKGGFPRHLASERELNKLDDFLSRLQRLDVSDTRQFLVYSGATRLATRITLDDSFSMYLRVEEL